MKSLSLIVCLVLTLLVTGCGSDAVFPPEDNFISCEEAMILQYEEGCYATNQDGDFASLTTMLDICSILQNQFEECPQECYDKLTQWYSDLASYECNEYLGEEGTPQLSEALLCCGLQTEPPKKEDPPHYDDDE